MVMSIMLAQGVSEKGAGRWLKPSQLLGEMLQKVGKAANSRGHPLVLLYCGDGSNDLHSWAKVEIKCLIRLIGHHCPGLEIVSHPFSFYDSDAVQKLNQGDIFYFKGFGAGVDQLQSIFGVEGVANPQYRDLVEHFQNRIMFSNPDGCQLLTFMICGAAILMGTH